MSENIIDLIQNAKTISVNMHKNTIILDDVEMTFDNVQFNCNWGKQTIKEILHCNKLNATCDNISMKTDSGKLNLPIKEYLLLKTDKHNIMSVGFYRAANENEILL